MLNAQKISNKMFIEALKQYGELTHDDLVKIFNDYDENPLMKGEKTIDSMYIGRGVGLCFSYKDKGREFEYTNQDIEDYDEEEIKLIYDYIS